MGLPEVSYAEGITDSQRKFADAIFGKITSILEEELGGYVLVEPEYPEFRIFWNGEYRIFCIYEGPCLRHTLREMGRKVMDIDDNAIYWHKKEDLGNRRIPILRNYREFKLSEVAQVVREAFGN